MFCFLNQKQRNEGTCMDALIISSLIQERGFLSQVYYFSCNMSLISKSKKHFTCYLWQPVQLQLLPLQHKSHSSRAPTILDSWWLIRHNMQFHTHMPLPGMPFPSTLIWLLFTHHTRGQAAPLWGFPWSRTPSFVPQQIYFSIGLLSLNYKNLSTLCL